MLDDRSKGAKPLGSIIGRRELDRSELASFVGRVVVPALVERFLQEHGMQAPSGGTLAKPKPAA